MNESRLLECVRRGDVALGALTLGVGPEIIETIGYAGFDYVVIDQMLTSVDWHDTAHMIRAAHTAGVTAIVRTPANPWVGTPDPRILADVTRALAIGADGVMVSISERQQAEQLMEVGSDWHRNVHIIPFGTEDFSAVAERVRASTLIVPLLESAEALENAEQILSVPGLRLAMIGVTDMAKEMGFPLQYEHPDVWAMVDRIVALGKKYDVLVGANTGYASASLEGQADRVRSLASHGASFVQTQTLQFLLQLAGMRIAGERPRIAH